MGGLSMGVVSSACGARPTSTDDARQKRRDGPQAAVAAANLRFLFASGSECKPSAEDERSRAGYDLSKPEGVLGKSVWIALDKQRIRIERS
jgi:hypothetical protein